MPCLSILIVSYNARDFLLNCLSSVYKYTADLECEVIVLDNNSDDQSADAVASQFPQVHLIRSLENMGFGRGNNRAASEASGEYLLLLNPDTLVRENTIQTLFQYAQEHPEAGAWGGVCELPDGSVDPGCRQLLPSLLGTAHSLFGMATRRVAYLDRSEAFAGRVQVLSGAFMMVRADVWQQLKGFDESFTLYTEETDLCHRIREAGYDIYMTGKARILHDSGCGDPHDPKRMLYLTRGVMHFYRKHYSFIKATCGAVLIWLHSLERFVGSFVLRPWWGGARCQRLRRRMSQVFCHPRLWWYGWHGQHL